MYKKIPKTVVCTKGPKSGTKKVASERQVDIAKKNKNKKRKQSIKIEKVY